MFDFDFLSRFDELTFRANMYANGSRSGSRTVASKNTKQQVSSDWYEEMLRKIQEDYSVPEEDGASTHNTSSANNSSQALSEISDGSNGARASRMENERADNRIRNMTREEYRDYISDCISGFRVSNTRSAGSQAIQISYDGLLAMQDDPEYEAWVLDNIERDLFSYDPWSGSRETYKVDYYGANKSDYHSRGNYGGYDNREAKQLFEEKSAGAVWSRGAGTEVSNRSASTSVSGNNTAGQNTADVARQNQQLLLEYYNALRSNPFSAGSSSILDSYMAMTGNSDDASDAWLKYAMSNMNNELF